VFLTTEDLNSIINEVYRRSIDLIIEHVRKTRDALDLAINAVSNFSSSSYNELKDIYEKISQIEEEADNIKRELIEQLTKSAPAFLYREDFFRFTVRIDEIIEYIQSFTRRLLKISESKIEPIPSVKDLLESILTNISSEYDHLKEAVMTLPRNPKKVLDLVVTVHEIESKVDLLYHSADFKLLMEIEDLRKLLLYRDLLHLLEEISDLIEDASDDLRVLALHRIV
jgi:predicted phosphate transport protein (TIGR00153 family)